MFRGVTSARLTAGPATRAGVLRAPLRGRPPAPCRRSAVTSLDGRRKLILAWTPGSRLLSNAEIPCLHADPFFGTIGPGRSAEARGVLILTEGPLDPAILQQAPC